MKSTHSTTALLAVALATASVLGSALADSVNIDIQGDIANTGGWYGTQGTYSGQGAATTTGNTWNGVKAGFDAADDAGPLVDDQNNPSSVSIHMTLTVNGGAWSYAPATGSPADALMGDYGFHNSGAPNIISLFTPDTSTTGLQLTAGSYWDVYVYTRGDNAGQGATVTLSQDAGDITQTSSGTTWGGSFVQGDNYVKFTSVTPTAFTGGFEFFLEVDGNGVGGDGTAIINGIQLVESSPPAGFPSFTVQPQPTTQSISVGDPFTITATAVGTPTPDYQWEYSEDGLTGWTELSGETGSSFSYSAAFYTDTGYYRVIASNLNGSIESEVAYVEVSYPDPTIDQQPQSKAVYQGDDLELTVVATTVDPADYQWYLGTSGDTSTPIPGAITDTLLISPAELSDAGDYWVRVTDYAPEVDGLPALTVDSATASVQVVPPREGVVLLVDFDASWNGGNPATSADFTAQGVPTLTAADPVNVSPLQPVDTDITLITFDSGLTVTFEDDDTIGGCAGAFAVDNGSALLNDYLYLQGDREGNGPTTVTVSGLNLEADTTYTLFLFGQGDAAATTKFTPVNSTNIVFQSIYPTVGNLAATFTTDASYAGEDLSFLWSLHTTNFAALNGLAIVPGDHGVVDFPPPAIVTQPQSTAVYEGADLQLTVSATTLDPAQFQWYLGTSGDTSTPIVGATTDTLTLTPAELTDSGDYWVRVTDTAATGASLPATTTDSDTATVQVLPPREGVVVLVDFDSGFGGANPATSADFTAQGVPTLTAADPVLVSDPQPISTEITSISLAGGVTVAFEDDDTTGGSNGAFQVDNGSALLDDYLYLEGGTESDGPTTVTVSGLSLDPDTTYTLFVFGQGDGAAATKFTPVNSTNIVYQNTNDAFGNLVVSFTTDPSYAGEDLAFVWDLNGTNFAALNGFAIVPGEVVPANDYAAWIGGYDVGALTGFNDDADGDGLSNGLENFLGTDPSTFNQGVTNSAKSGSTFTFEHPQNDNPASDLSAAYRWSPDLANWYGDGASDGSTTVTFAPSTAGGTTTVTATISGVVPAQTFFDIEVTQP